MNPQTRSGPVSGWCAPITSPIAYVWAAVSAWRNRRFDRGVGVERVGIPVISVGNIVAGGTGKSPFVRWIAREAIRDGQQPIIAMRGYRSKLGASDEATEHAESLQGVALAVGPNRAAEIRSVLGAHQERTLAILDDGFQHRQIARDLDIVLIDAMRPNLDGAMMPRGWLREAATSLRRANAVVVTKSSCVDAVLAARIERLHGRAPVAWCGSCWTGLGLFGGAGKVMDRVATAWLSGKSIGVWTAIAHGEDVSRAAQEAGASVVSVYRGGDHAEFTARQVARLEGAAIESGAAAILMTGKDWVKVRRLNVALRLPVIVPELSLVFHEGETALRSMLQSAWRSRYPRT